MQTQSKPQTRFQYYPNGGRSLMVAQLQWKTILFSRFLAPQGCIRACTVAAKPSVLVIADPRWDPETLSPKLGGPLMKPNYLGSHTRSYEFGISVLGSLWGSLASVDFPGILEACRPPARFCFGLLFARSPSQNRSVQRFQHTIFRARKLRTHVSYC